jgi:hypothetical protein
MLKKQNPKQHKTEKKEQKHITKQNINSAVYICSALGIKHEGVDKHDGIFNSL